jgi:hypothetical protein
VRRPSLFGAPSQAMVPPLPIILTTNGMPRLYWERLQSVGRRRKASQGECLKSRPA